MKKVYSKPQIVFDSFELSQSIAAGCEFISNQAMRDCALQIEDMPKTIFTQKGVCGIWAPGRVDQICYDIPRDSNNVFSS